MCGLTGFWTPPGHFRDEKARAVVTAMAEVIRYRGPDGSGVWTDPEIGIALGHRRLSILDLSQAGAQPMVSASGRYVVIYNGEIYNHLQMRAELQTTGRAPDWRGHSDTETLLASFEAYGVAETLKRAFGMCAIALWDRAERALFLARDRIGEKPIYWGRSGNTLLFGSELKCFASFPGFAPAVDERAADLFLRLSYIPAPLSIFAGVRKLPPGHFVRIASLSDEATPKPYWTLDETIADARREEMTADFESTVDQVGETLREVVTSQMISDVPLGAFLSGGIDSSLVTALMVEASQHRVKTFSIGFDDPRFDESEHAKAVATYLGTDHHALTVTDRDALNLIPSLPDIYDEPFADSSQLPTTLLCRMARQELTVCLSGDGGDEMFAGYNRHVSGPGVWRRLDHMPLFARYAVARTALGLEGLLGRAPAVRDAAERRGLPTSLLDKMSRFANAIGPARSFEDFYGRLVSTGGLLSGQAGPELPPDDGVLPPDWLRERVMRWDILTYLPDDIMVKVDRAAMHASLETRSPFLDVRTIAAAWRVSREHRTSHYGGKSILKGLLYRRVPREILDRPKKGFTIPLNRWLDGELQDWADGLVRAYAKRHAGDARENRVLLLWDAHRTGRRRNGEAIWNVAMLESWLERWADSVDPKLP